MWTGKVPVAAPASAAAEETPPKRLHYLDSIKIVLSVLVVAHHAAQPYGPMDWWYVEGQPRAQWIEDLAVLNAPFKMSLFFLIAAYFLPAAIDRRRTRPYLKPRLAKLGGPVLVGFFLVIPVLMYAYYLNFRPYEGLGFGDYYLNVYLGAGEEPADWSGPIWPDRQFGHLWFLQHLLVYSLLYWLWRAVVERVSRRRPDRGTSVTGPRPVTGSMVFCFVAAVAIATAGLRIWYPVDTWVPVLEIIQAEPADFAQHALFVVVGVLAYRHGWLRTLTPRIAYGWLAVAVGLSAAYVVFRDTLTAFFELGGANLGSFGWSAFEAVLCVGWSLGFLVFFRDHLAGSSRWQKTAADSTFAIYLLHLPIVVGLQYLLRGSPLGASADFLLVAVFGLVLSVLTAAVLRRTPGIRTIL